MTRDRQKKQESEQENAPEVLPEAAHIPDGGVLHTPGEAGVPLEEEIPLAVLLDLLPWALQDLQIQQEGHHLEGDRSHHL